MLVSEDLIGAVCASLATLAEHVGQFSPEAYREPAVELGGASIGQHVRHCLDHYQTIVDNLDEGRFDYDVRVRDTEVECDRQCAIDRMRALAEPLRGLRSADLQRDVEVRTASSSAGDVAWHRSSLGRELQFVVGHTVHHSAMIAASCRVRDLPLPADCGVAASTLRFRASTS